MTRKRYNYNFDPTQEYTKQDIQRITGLSKNAIPPALEVAGLSTSQRAYSGEELLTYFVPVRQLIDSGMSYDQVREALQMNRANVSNDDYRGGGGDGSASGGLSTLDRVIEEGIAETVYGAVDAAVNDLVEYIPQMVAIALSKAASQGKIRDAFKRNQREYFATRRTLDFHLGTDLRDSLPSAAFDDEDEFPDTSSAWLQDSFLANSEIDAPNDHTSEDTSTEEGDSSPT